MCWGASLAVAHAWTWSVPAAAAAVIAVALLAVVAALITSATSRISYRRAGLGTAGAFGLVALDMTMLVAVPLLAPSPVWPMLMAVRVSRGPHRSDAQIPPDSTRILIDLPSPAAAGSSVDLLRAGESTGR
jgi:hypothetical protein